MYRFQRLRAQFYLTLDEKEMFVDPSDQDSAKIGRRSSVLVADMEVDGKSRSRNLAFFDVTQCHSQPGITDDPKCGKQPC